jgi:hypothetical protein
VVSFTPQPLYRQGKNPGYSLDRRLGGPQSRSGRGGEEKSSQPLPGLEPLIIQPVAQRPTTELSRFLVNRLCPKQVLKGLAWCICVRKDEKFFFSCVKCWARWLITVPYLPLISSLDFRLIFILLFWDSSFSSYSRYSYVFMV